MRILVACEESQVVCGAFREKGHDAYSCDIQPCSGGHPKWHIQRDVTDVLKEKWDIIIAHPPCTYLTVTGNRWFNVEKYGEKAIQRMKYREEAIKFFMMFVNAKCDKIAIENPVGIINTIYRKPDQIVQPYWFGDAAEKRTCLWLKNLPILKPTNIVEPPPRQKLKSGKSMPEWYSNAKFSDRSKIRSTTFKGLAEAMADQWG